MDFLKLLDFSSFIIFSDDPWSLLVSFRQLFKLPLVVQCCDLICEWPLIFMSLRRPMALVILKSRIWLDIVKEMNTITRTTCCFDDSIMFGVKG